MVSGVLREARAVVEETLDLSFEAFSLGAELLEDTRQVLLEAWFVHDGYTSE